MTESQPGAERLQKILARAGYGSRRACEEFIVEGRVTINDQTVTQLGVKADPFRDTIAVDTVKLKMPKPVYYIIHKPEGVFFSDKSADASLEDFIKGDMGRLFSAGRLDQFSRGLMVVTNDGRVANVLTHPRYKVPKVFKVTVKGNLQPQNVKNIERALFYAMNNGRFEPIALLKHGGAKSIFRLTVYEGLPQSLKDICLKFGHGIKQIERIRVGIVELAGLETGRSRKLNKPEIDAMMEYVDKADAGKMDYENALLTPDSFDRDAESTNFRRKPKGTNSKTVGQRKTRTRVQSKSGSDRSSSDRKPAGRKPSGGKPSSSRGSSDRKPYGDRPSSNRSSSDRRPAGGGKPNPSRAGSDRKPYGDRPSSNRSSSDRRPAGGGKPNPSRAGSDRKPYGDRPSSNRSSSDRKPAGRKPSSGKPSSSRGSSDRKPYGDRPSSNRSSSDRKPAGRKPLGGKPSSSRSGSDRKPSSRPSANRGGSSGTRKPASKRPGGKPASRGKPSGGKRPGGRK